MKIDFDGIQAFVEVAELGGFHKAADRLHISQTALTRRVQKLESYLGLKLLDRTTRSVELTAVGAEFLPKARAIVGEMQSAVGRLREMSRTSRGSFTLACVPSMAGDLLPHLFLKYSQRYPSNRIRLLDMVSQEVREAVLSHKAEFGIGVHGESHPDLEEFHLFDDPLMLYCRDSHPFFDRDTVRWNDLRDEDLIMVRGFTNTRVLMDYQMVKHGISLEGTYEVQHQATAINLVAAGVGCAILPWSTLGAGDRPHVRKIPLTHPVVRRKVMLYTRRHASLSPAAQAFIDLLHRHHRPRERAAAQLRQSAPAGSARD